MGVHANLRCTGHATKNVQSDLTPVLGSSCVYDDHPGWQYADFRIVPEMAPLQPV